MPQIAVVDYGMGNLRSVSKALEHVVTDGQDVIVTADPQAILNADRVVFPGQGAARDCLKELTDRQLIEPVLQAAAEKPFLGICMGAQVLLAHSEENQGVDCLALYDGEVKFFGERHVDTNGQLLKIPHMGWNQVKYRPHSLWHDIAQDSRFYFVHSYYMSPEDNIIAATTEYGRQFVSAIMQKNVFAVQFHPEKSAADGLQLLKNFIQWDPKED